MLDGHGRDIMSTILDRYLEIIRILKKMQWARDNNTAFAAGMEAMKVVGFCIKFLDEIDIRFVDLLDQAR